MGNAKAENWLDPAGTDPETGEPWRVCDMVAKLEAALGRTHNAKRRAAWQALWNDSMTRNAASTSKHEAPVLAGTPDDQAVAAANAAEEVLSAFLKPGRWATKAARARFLRSGQLEKVLSLYETAIHADPREPAYPWNLAASLDRLGLPDLALVYMRRAIRPATEVGDEEWADAHAHLALADIALNAGEREVAMLAVEHARSLDPGVPAERYVRRARDRKPEAAVEEREDTRDAARKGKAIEHLIAATCMMASGFELNVSTNLVDDEGVDLVFHRRDSPVTLSVQVKSRSWTAGTMRRARAFRAQVREATFATRPDLYLLFVAVDARVADYGPVWLVPSEKFAEQTSVNARGLRRFAASPSAASTDRWSTFRLERSQLPNRLVEILREREASGGR